MPKLIYGKYYLTQNGDIYNHHTGKKLKPWITGNGYLRIMLYDKGRRYIMVHRLVYEYFIGEIPAGLEINHKNHIRTDNNLDNLELVDRKGNMQHAAKAGRMLQVGGKNRKKPVLNEDTNEWFPSSMQASLSLGLNKWAVHQALKRKQKTCGGYRWRYA